MEGDLFGGIVVTVPRGPGDVDHYYLIHEHPERDTALQLRSYFFNVAKGKLIRSQSYPIRLQDLEEAADRDLAIRLFMHQLDRRLLLSLQVRGLLNDLRVYALLREYPWLKTYLNEPLLLLVAATQRRHLDALFEQSPRINLRTWLGHAFNRSRISRSQLNCIRKLTLPCDYRKALYAVQLIVQHFDTLAPFLRKEQTIPLNGLYALWQLLQMRPSLAHARWLRPHDVDLYPLVFLIDFVEEYDYMLTECQRRLRTNDPARLINRMFKTLQHYLTVLKRWEMEDDWGANELW